MNIRPYLRPAKRMCYQLRNYTRHFFKERYIVNKLGNLDDLVDFDLVTSNVKQIDANILPIYVMWWQGEHSMPPIVQACYHNLLRKAGKHPVYLITQENVMDFVDENDGHWDSIAFQKVREGNLKLPQFADILRAYLTAYGGGGGIWIDATVYVTADSVDDFIAIPFSSGRRTGRDLDNGNPSRCRWTTFYFSALTGNPLCQFIYNGLIKLLYRDNKIKEYFTIDYLFNYAYKHVKGVKELVESSPSYSNLFHACDGEGTNAVYVKEEFDALCVRTPFLKLTYKGQFKEYVDGKQTIYGYLIEER